MIDPPMAAAVKETTRMPRISVTELSPTTMATMPVAVERITGTSTPTDRVTIGLVRLRLRFRLIRSILTAGRSLIPSI